MFTKQQFIKKLIKEEENILGDKHYTAYTFGFYDLLEESGLEKEEYESFVKNLYHEGLLKIDMNGSTDFSRAQITATAKASELL